MPAHLRDRYVSQTPVGRLGQPEDIAQLALFLASPASAYVTATAIPCDGGLSGATRGGLSD